MIGSPKYLVALVLSVAVISCGVSAVPRGNNSRVIIVIQWHSACSYHTASQTTTRWRVRDELTTIVQEPLVPKLVTNRQTDSSWLLIENSGVTYLWPRLGCLYINIIRWIPRIRGEELLNFVRVTIINISTTTDTQEKKQTKQMRYGYNNDNDKLGLQENGLV